MIAYQAEKTLPDIQVVYKDLYEFGLLGDGHAIAGFDGSDYVGNILGYPKSTVSCPAPRINDFSAILGTSI